MWFGSSPSCEKELPRRSCFHKCGSERSGPIKNKFEKKPLQPKLDNNKVSPQVPAELQGLHLKTKDNKPLCWHRNLQKGCSNQVKRADANFATAFV